jgi:general stress protein 26
MDEFKTAITMMEKLYGHDVTLSLATCRDGDVSVRVVNGYYKDGCIYVLTHLSSNKMKQIQHNPKVALCRDLFQATGTAMNIGHPLDEDNKALTPELRRVFSTFYDRHVDEADPGTCILKIQLSWCVVFDNSNKYVVDFCIRAAQRLDFVNDIVMEESNE